MRYRALTLILAVALLAACGKDEPPPATTPPGYSPGQYYPNQNPNHPPTQIPPSAGCQPNCYGYGYTGGGGNGTWGSGGASGWGTFPGGYYYYSGGRY